MRTARKMQVWGALVRTRTSSIPEPSFSNSSTLTAQASLRGIHVALYTFAKPPCRRMWVTCRACTAH